MEGMQTVDTQSASTSRRQTWLAGSDVSWTFVFFTSQELGQGQDRLGRVRSPLQELVHLRHILEPKTPKRTGKGMIAQYCPNMQNKSSDELPHFHARWLQICIAQPLSSHLLDELLRQTSPTPCGERSKIYNKNKVQTNPQMHLDVSRVSTSFSSYASIRWPSVCYFSLFCFFLGRPHLGQSSTMTRPVIQPPSIFELQHGLHQLKHHSCHSAFCDWTWLDWGALIIVVLQLPLIEISF